MTTPEPESRTWYARIRCPSCYEPVDVAPHAREGRCADCRPIRRHSPPRRNPRDEVEGQFRKYVAQHTRPAHHSQ